MYKFLPFGVEVSTEAALPKESGYVVTIDHSNAAQVKNMKKLFEILPDYGITKALDKDILPILEGDFKVSAAIDISKFEEGLNGLDVVSVYTSEVGKMKNVLEKEKPKDFFYGNDGNIFVFAPTQAEVDSSLKRLRDGNGFSTNEDFKNASKDSKGNLGYVYVNQKDTAVKNLYLEVVADEDGFGFGGLGNLSSDKDLVAKDFPYLGDKLSLFDRVPLENPILYIETPNVGPYIGSFVAGFSGKSTFDAAKNVVYDQQKDYDSFLTLVSDFSGISKEDARGIFESRFAFAVGDSGEKYPTVSLYFDVGDKDADTFKKMVGVLDGYSDAVIKEFEAITGLKGAIKKGASIVRGGGMHKLYIDLSAVPDEMLANFALIPGLDLKKMKIEIYYGLTGDNVLTIALYPQFDKAYGENVVGKNKDVLSALQKAGSNPFEVLFFSPEKLINFVDTNYYKMAKDYGMLNGNYEKYYALAKDTMQALKYLVSSSSMPVNDKVLFDGFLKFQKVLKNDALEKVKEGK